MQARILSLLFVLTLALATEPKLTILHDRATIKAKEMKEVRLFCNSNSTYANYVFVHATEGDVIGKDDTFQVRTKTGCSSSSCLNTLSSQGSVSEFTWSDSYHGQLLDSLRLCVEIQCTNYFMACYLTYSFIVNCI
jgi:hypothetical protein